MKVSLNLSYQLMSMDITELKEYREELVKLYIGEYKKPYWYSDKLKEIDTILKFKSQRIQKQ